MVKKAAPNNYPTNSKRQNGTNNRPKQSLDHAPSRQLKHPHYKTFRLSKRIPHQSGKLATVFVILQNAYTLLRKQWKQITGITLLYIVMTVVLVKGFSATADLASMKDTLSAIFGSDISNVSKVSALFSSLMSTAGTSAGEVASLYQSIMLVLFSLVYVWALRMTAAGQAFTVREAFYKSSYPLVPFLVVLGVGMLQMIPAAIGGFMANIAYAGGVAVTPIEEVLWALLIFLLFLWSLYMLVSTMIAMYIVTLPDMKPLQALRSARNVVMFRRWTIVRKVLFLIVFMIGALIVIMAPVLLFLTPVAEWVYMALVIVGLPVIHAYLYSLYRELL